MNTAKEKATKLVNEAIKDHDDGGYAYVSMNEILITKIAQALEQASRTPIKWPDEETAQREFLKIYDESRKMSAIYYFLSGVEWLKSFVEEDKSE